MTKSNLRALLLLTSFCLLTAVNCDETESETYTVSVYSPIYASLEEARKPIETSDPRKLKETGKIYIKDDYIFINEKNEGVHVIDNSVPNDPRNIAFISIPGNIDIAVRDNILYADSYTDLVALDIANPASVQEVKRIEDVFENRYEDPWSMAEFGWGHDYESVDPDKGIVVGWEKTGTRKHTDTWEPERTGFGCTDEAMMYQDSAGGGSVNDSTGKGGSMAKFTIVDDYLYVLGGYDMQLFRIDEPADPTTWVTISIAWDIETIFPYEDKLFIGSMSGMYIYDNSDPSNPTMITQFAHATSCDPVYVQGDYAYVTLRGGTACGGYTNQLDIIDIGDLTAPALVKTYAMQGPLGLAADGNTLFICDGSAGVKVFDSTDVLNLELITQIDDYSAYDIILNNNIAMVISPSGLYQYDYSDLDDINLLSSILVAGQE